MPHSGPFQDTYTQLYGMMNPDSPEVQANIDEMGRKGYEFAGYPTKSLVLPNVNFPGKTAVQGINTTGATPGGTNNLNVDTSVTNWWKNQQWYLSLPPVIRDSIDTALGQAPGNTADTEDTNQGTDETPRAGQAGLLIPPRFRQGPADNFGHQTEAERVADFARRNTAIKPDLKKSLQLAQATISLGMGGLPGLALGAAKNAIMGKDPFGGMFDHGETFTPNEMNDMKKQALASPNPLQTMTKLVNNARTAKVQTKAVKAAKAITSSYNAGRGRHASQDGGRRAAGGAGSFGGGEKTSSGALGGAGGV